MKIDIFDTIIKRRKSVLALGPESSGNFSIYNRGKIYYCQLSKDLLDERSFSRFKKTMSDLLKRETIKPDVILTDLHPRYRTSVWGKELARGFGVKNIEVQHHLAHIFSSLGDKIIQDPSYEIPEIFYGIACDGTGFGFDGKIWGGEVFQVKNEKLKVKSIKRTGRLENQILIGGDLAIKEPARMLTSILKKFLDKKKVYGYVKKYYSPNHFKVLCNQAESGFNCLETSSTARILDAAAILLGFSKNARDEKHGPVLALAKNSTRPYKLQPKIIYDREEKKYILLTTPLFEYLLKNMEKDKGRLAATVQSYLARGLYGLVKKIYDKQNNLHDTYFSGGMADNKIMSDYLSSHGFYLSKKIPRGDAGISFGQVIYYLAGANRSLE